MMKKTLVLLVFTQVLGQRMGNCQNLSTVYSETRCGLNYTQASVLLGKKMVPYGYPFFGVDQPAPLSISGIPASATIEKAFLWWDIAGNDTAENVIILNPELLTDTFIGESIGGNENMCWGNGRGFRADVTEIVSGNGTYYISGLPTDTTFDFENKSDVNGTTLMIIYSDYSYPYLGNIFINDGYLKIALDTVLETMHFDPPSDTVYGKAFMVLSDMQGEPGTAIKMNNGPFSVPSQEYWDFEQKNTVYVPSINYSVFGVRAPNDCVQLLVSGIYYQSSIIPLEPLISRFGDVLTSSQASAYQWYFNNNILPGETNESLLASSSGIYYVEVTDSFGCKFLSDTLQVTICSEKVKPNINLSFPDSLWTDSIGNNLQWYLNGNAIPGATESYLIASASGAYWVQAQDSTGCSVNSDIVTVTNDNRDNSFLISEKDFTIYPNPARGNFYVQFSDGVSIMEKMIEIYNPLGKKIFFKEKAFGNSAIQINISDQPKGIYFLLIKSNDKTGYGKVNVE